MHEQDEIIHEIRTALAVIRGRAQLSSRRLAADGVNQQHTLESNNQIIDETRRIEMLLARMERGDAVPLLYADIQIDMYHEGR